MTQNKLLTTSKANFSHKLPLLGDTLKSVYTFYSNLSSKGSRVVFAKNSYVLNMLEKQYGLSLSRQRLSIIQQELEALELFQHIKTVKRTKHFKVAHFPKLCITKANSLANSKIRSETRTRTHKTKAVEMFTSDKLMLTKQVANVDETIGLIVAKATTVSIKESSRTVDDKRCVATQASKAATLEDLIAKYGNELVTKVQARAAKYKQSNSLRYLEASLANEFTLQEQKMELRKARETPQLPAPPLYFQEDVEVAKANFPTLLELCGKYKVCNLSFDNFTMNFSYVGNPVSLDLTDPKFVAKFHAYWNPLHLRENAEVLDITFDEFLKKHVKSGLELINMESKVYTPI